MAKRFSYDGSILNREVNLILLILDLALVRQGAVGFFNDMNLALGRIKYLLFKRNIVLGKTLQYHALI